MPIDFIVVYRPFRYSGPRYIGPPTVLYTNIDLVTSIFFLGGLGWHLPGLSEFPPEHRLLLRLAGPFQLFFPFYTFFVLAFSPFHFSFLLFLRFSTTISVKFGLCELVFSSFEHFSCRRVSTADLQLLIIAAAAYRERSKAQGNHPYTKQ